MAGIKQNRQQALRSSKELCDRVGFPVQPFQMKIASALFYRGVIDGYLLDESARSRSTRSHRTGSMPTEKLIAEDRLSARVIVRHLTILHV